MAVGLSEPQQLLPINGIQLATIAAGIRYQGRDDVALMTLPAHATVAGMFTQNAFCAAPVIVAREHLAATAPRAWLINAGNANAGTGQNGLQAARQSCATAAQALGCADNAVLPFSTGVIGEDLPVEKFTTAMPALVSRLDANNWLGAARAIMTTDTVAKGASRTVEIGGETITLTGIIKGVGMVRPDMATVLGFIGTDARIDPATLQQALRTAINQTVNAVTVDGDTSTNDACVIAATQLAGPEIVAETAAYQSFVATLTDLCLELAQALVRDGEGATKFVAIQVEQAKTPAEAQAVAYTVAHSPLVKTALFASDPNWGRILAAVGRAPVENLDANAVQIWLDEVLIACQGGRAPEYTEAAGQAVMNQEDITIRIALGRGEARTTVWTSDFSYDYVKINAEYRS